MIFEWDLNKNRLNKKKHKVDFEEAETVFRDEKGLWLPDPDHSDDEDRYLMLGLSEKLRILVVHFCERNGNALRIFSARRANKIERKDYEVNL
jgi:uncharacterized DUF497 family protein